MQYARYTNPTADQPPGSAVGIAEPDDMEHAFADARDMPSHALSQPMLRSRNRTALMRNWSSVPENLSNANDEVDFVFFLPALERGGC